MLFLLKLKEKYKVTQVALDFVLSAVIEFIAIPSAKIKRNVLDKLKELNFEDLDALNTCFLPVNPFSELLSINKLGLIVSNKLDVSM